MVAKCGTKIVHHWAHSRRSQCDPWWENETDWHRTWKKRFPEELREVIQHADDGEIHIADVKTSTGIVLEFQHSGMTDIERISREQFYRNMVWVIDALGFKSHFHLMNFLPERNTDIARDLVWMQREHTWSDPQHGMFWRRSENPDIAPSGPRPGQAIMITSDTQRSAIEHPDYRIGLQRQYHWVRPRATWLDSAVPVYLDLGNELLWRLETYDDSGLRCAFPVQKAQFVSDAMVKSHARDIATR
jgi:competence protein CoiA